MSDQEWETDEDRNAARLFIHRDLIGWVIKELQKEGIQAERTKNNNPDGDILVLAKEDVPRVKQLIRQWNEQKS
ncbi:MAG: hypothetical protein WBB43_23700 [Limnoraphis sp.]